MTQAGRKSPATSALRSAASSGAPTNVRPLGRHNSDRSDSSGNSAVLVPHPWVADSHQVDEIERLVSVPAQTEDPYRKLMKAVVAAKNLHGDVLSHSDRSLMSGLRLHTPPCL